MRILERLFDLGETGVINNLIYETFPYLKMLHDDAVILDLKKYSSIAVSTDPCPEPLICRFDEKNKYYHYGIMSVLINYSDLAATGVEPIGILMSTVMPNEMYVKEYSQFLQGVKDACVSWGGSLLGGNIKDGKEFSVTGTAIGGQVSKRVLKRTGCKEGDVICIIGDPGMFWLAILKLLENSNLKQLDDYTKSFVISPRPKNKEGLILSQSDISISCMDSSDGIIGCLYEIASLNNVSIEIDDDKLIPNILLRQYCDSHDIDYRNLLLSFGGWELVFTCPMESVDNLTSLFSMQGCKFTVIGKIVEKTAAKVMLNKNNKLYGINDFSSKRFSNNSYFSFGLDSFINQFNHCQLYKIV